MIFFREWIAEIRFIRSSFATDCSLVLLIYVALRLFATVIHDYWERGEEKGERWKKNANEEMGRKKRWNLFVRSRSDASATIFTVDGGSILLSTPLRKIVEAYVLIFREGVFQLSISFEYIATRECSTKINFYYYYYCCFIIVVVIAVFERIE